MADVVPLIEERDEETLRKIKNFADRFGFSLKVVLDEICARPVLQAVFAKEPGRQGTHEKLAASFIKKIPHVSAFGVLGKNKYVVVQGGVMLRKDARKSGTADRAKSLDFTWKLGDFEFYASHKYTKEGGGAQDNQYEDLKGFIEAANASNRRFTIFLAMADGPYYETMDTGAGVSRLQRLKDLANRRNVFAVSSYDLEAFLKDFAAKIAP